MLTSYLTSVLMEILLLDRFLYGLKQSQPKFKIHQSRTLIVPDIDNPYMTSDYFTTGRNHDIVSTYSDDYVIV